MTLRALLAALGLPLLIQCGTLSPMETAPNPLRGRLICIDPGHGGTAETDDFRVGPTGEREEWINLRVALILRDLLEARGATVLMTRTEDVPVGLRDRAVMAVEASAEVFLSIHHNATADPEVNFPIIYYHGHASENPASVALGRALARHLAETLFDGETPVSLVSDHVIFPTSGTAVLRHSYGIPGVIGEASFFTHPAEEQRLRDPEHNRREAEAYVAALEEFFRGEIDPIVEKGSLVTVPPFEVFQEDDRMRPEALAWRENFERGCALMEERGPEALEEAYRLLTLSARAFPDSPVARECHWRRTLILERQGNGEQAHHERPRVTELYVDLDD
jgi:N-acetylmuramoyl-L-alanine amidase